MATLSKNGVETARVELLRKTYSFRSNGKVLKNDGFGWKLVTLKAGVTPDQFLANLRSREANLTPLFREYRARVQSEFPLSIRWRYLEMSFLLDGDIDGIWAHLDDHGIHVDLETLRELDLLRQALEREDKEPVAV